MFPDQQKIRTIHTVGYCSLFYPLDFLDTSRISDSIVSIAISQVRYGIVGKVMISVRIPKNPDSVMGAWRNGRRYGLK